MSQEFDNKRDENAAKQSCRYDFEPCGDSYIEGASFGYDYRQEEIDELKQQLEFTKQYFNPKDTSFQQMIDAFMVLSDEKKNQLIELSQLLLKIKEDEI